MLRRLLVLIAAVSVVLVAVAGWAVANVIPDNPRAGDQATTRMWCFKGIVTFTMVGASGSIVIGSTQATPLPEGKAELSFIVPNVTPGSYTMVGSGTGCDDNRPREVRVPFVVRPTGNYPPTANAVTTDRNQVETSGRVIATAKYFLGSVEFKLVESGQQLGAAVADGDGVASLSFSAPASAGVYTVSATGKGADGAPTSVSTSFRVLANADSPTTTAPASNAPVTTAAAPPSTSDVLPTPGAQVVVPQVQVQGVTQVSGSVLARTGANSLSTIRIGLIIASIGGALLVVGRRRNRLADAGR